MKIGITGASLPVAGRIFTVKVCFKASNGKKEQEKARKSKKEQVD
jgi:hypothetical protein